jgi:ABC-2 type transport system permease protein
MNLEHLKAVVWLRWRLKRNQFRRGGVTNAVLGVLLLAAVASTVVGSFALGLAVGLSALPGAAPPARLLAWDGLVVAVLFFWAIGLLIELQKAEGLSLDRFLHLPVSPFGAFLVNYLATWVGLTTVTFVPGLVGLILGGTVADGPLTLLALPLLGAFLFALTAVTYQFQGWLASLMTNPRRRRTVVVSVTAGFVLLAQVPNLLNIAGPWRHKASDARKRKDDRNQEAVARANARSAETTARWTARRDRLGADLIAKRITWDEHQEGLEKSEVEFDADKERDRAEFKAESERIEDEHRAEANAGKPSVPPETVVRLVNVVLPPGWLPLGAAALADGNPVPALLGTVGYGLIGAVCLRRAYRTTVRLYTGEFTHAGGGVAAAVAAADPARVRMAEWRLPYVPEAAAGVAAAGLRSLLRAPEVKMLMIAPVAMAVVAVGVAASASGGVPAVARPFAAAGVAALMVLPVMQLVGNQFGYDRNGFRAYVLGPVRRRDILLGKNLAIAPFALVPALLAAVVVGVVYPMRLDRFLAVPVQTVSMFLLACVVANGLAVYAPIPIPAGGFKPGKVRMLPALAQGAGFFAYPVVMGVTLLPLGADALGAEFAGLGAWPVGLVLSAVGLALSAAAYRMGLAEVGHWLADREQAVLEVVTGREE